MGLQLGLHCTALLSHRLYLQKIFTSVDPPVVVRQRWTCPTTRCKRVLVSSAFVQWCLIPGRLSRYGSQRELMHVALVANWQPANFCAAGHQRFPRPSVLRCYPPVGYTIPIIGRLVLAQGHKYEYQLVRPLSVLVAAIVSQPQPYSPSWTNR